MPPGTRQYRLRGGSTRALDLKHTMDFNDYHPSAPSTRPPTVFELSTKPLFPIKFTSPSFPRASIGERAEIAVGCFAGRKGIVGKAIAEVFQHELAALRDVSRGGNRARQVPPHLLIQFDEAEICHGQNGAADLPPRRSAEALALVAAISPEFLAKENFHGARAEPERDRVGVL